MGRIDLVLPFNDITVEVAKEYLDKHLKNKDVNVDELILSSEIDKYGLRNLKNLVNKYNKKTVYN